MPGNKKAISPLQKAIDLQPHFLEVRKRLAVAVIQATKQPDNKLKFEP